MSKVLPAPAPAPAPALAPVVKRSAASSAPSLAGTRIVNEFAARAAMHATDPCTYDQPRKAAIERRIDMQGLTQDQRAAVLQHTVKRCPPGTREVPATVAALRALGDRMQPYTGMSKQATKKALADAGVVAPNVERIVCQKNGDDGLLRNGEKENVQTAIGVRPGSDWNQTLANVHEILHGGASCGVRGRRVCREGRVLAEQFAKAANAAAIFEGVGATLIPDDELENGAGHGVADLAGGAIDVFGGQLEIPTVDVSGGASNALIESLAGGVLAGLGQPMTGGAHGSSSLERLAAIPSVQHYVRVASAPEAATASDLFVRHRAWEDDTVKDYIQFVAVSRQMCALMLIAWNGHVRLQRRKLAKMHVVEVKKQPTFMPIPYTAITMVRQLVLNEGAFMRRAQQFTQLKDLAYGDLTTAQVPALLTGATDVTCENAREKMGLATIDTRPFFADYPRFNDRVAFIGAGAVPVDVFQIPGSAVPAPRAGRYTVPLVMPVPNLQTMVDAISRLGAQRTQAEHARMAEVARYARLMRSATGCASMLAEDQNVIMRGRMRALLADLVTYALHGRAEPGQITFAASAVRRTLLRAEMSDIKQQDIERLVPSEHARELMRRSASALAVFASRVDELCEE